MAEVIRVTDSGVQVIASDNVGLVSAIIYNAPAFGDSTMSFYNGTSNSDPLMFTLNGRTADANPMSYKSPWKVSGGLFVETSSGTTGEVFLA